MVGDKLILNIRGGARIAVPPQLNQITTYTLLEQEDWFEEEIRFVRHWLRPGMRAVDVGASYGTYALAMARAVGDTGQVWAFEPTAQVADYLEFNLRLNALPHAKVSRDAISDRLGTMTFATQEKPELNRIVRQPGSADVIEVPGVTLDDAAARLAWRDIDFIKLDVEGHECEAINGGAGFLRGESPLLMFEIKREETTDLRALETLEGFGYAAYRLLPGPLALVPFGGTPEPFDLNVFACKSDHAEQLAAAGMLHSGGRMDTPAPEVGAWVEYLHRTVYGKAFEPAWRSAANRSRRAGRDLYIRGLASFALSQAQTRPLGERLSLLNDASRCVSEALLAYDSPARRMTYARLAWELGARSHAVKALELVAGKLTPDSAFALEEPFLTPSPQHERLDPRGNPGWLWLAVLEPLEKLHSYSSYFRPGQSLQYLEMILSVPQHAPEMDRRRELSSFLVGKPLAPTPALTTRGAENLNPEFWSAWPASI